MRFTGEKIRVYVTGDEFTGESWKGGGVAIRFNDGRSEAPLFDSTKNHFELLGYIYTYIHTHTTKAFSKISPCSNSPSSGESKESRPGTLAWVLLRGWPLI